MEYATFGQLDARLTEIDGLLLKADLGEVEINSTERSNLSAEAEAIMDVLARELGERQNIDPKVVYKLRNDIRQLHYIATVGEKHLKAHPEPRPEDDRIIREAFEGLKDGTKTKEEVASAIYSVFADVFPTNSDTQTQNIEHRKRDRLWLPSA